MVLNDENIETLVNWCNLFGKFIESDDNFRYLGEYIAIAIKKNESRLPFTANYIWHVLGQIYYYSNQCVEAE